MASNKIEKVAVSSAAEMDQAVTGYLAQGFTVANRTTTSVTLQKRKEFSVLWAVLGFLICLLPLLIYLVVYATRPDVEIVEIFVVSDAEL
jgi:hypothetical protein